MADGESLPGPRARSAAGKHARDLDTIASDETGLQRCPRQLRKLLPLGRRQVARHATSRKAATAAFNPHSAPPPERRFSATRSFDYRSRGNAIASGSMGAPRPPVKRLSALSGVLCYPDQWHATAVCTGVASSSNPTLDSVVHSDLKNVSKSALGFHGLAFAGSIPAFFQNASRASRFIFRLVVMYLPVVATLAWPR